MDVGVALAMSGDEVINPTYLVLGSCHINLVK